MPVLGTAPTDLPLLAPGARVAVRDEDWLLTQVQDTKADGRMLKAIGLSELVRDQGATFFTNLDVVVPQRPEDTKLVLDKTPGFRRSRLYLDALLRRTPLPITETRPAIGHRQLLDEVEYQKRAVAMALEQPRPRLLIADSVGLGKTLEIGMILSELIRRGRGERILVVVPRAILEQFQHELWTRFAIPLVRLDSEGLQRLRQHIPPTRNPFTYYKRAIISIDTLKSVGKYSHHLEPIHWDAVVLDECHNLVNATALRNRLARLLAPRTAALLLASATPHNGKRESFAELIGMLDSTAIADPSDYKREDIDHLYVRRFKKDVAAEVGHAFPERRPPKPIAVTPSPEEERVFDELADGWLYPGPDGSPVSGKGSRLFPWTLLKAFLSSDHALRQTISNRRSKLDDAVGEGVAKEDAALARLDALAAEIEVQGVSTKLDRLAAELKAIGLGRRSPVRAVVFSERIATLHWLAEALPARLGLKPQAVRVLHASLSDAEQHDVVEQFGQADSPIRLLLTGDLASEGVNLHRACHHLIHFDIPWSVIRIDQRNGRIDRYGQEHPPEIRALILTPANDRVRGDLTVLRRLLEKEDEIHRTLGEAAALMGLHEAGKEEEAILAALAAGQSAAEAVPEEPDQDGFDLLALLAGSTDQATVDTMTPLTLTTTTAEFVEEALREAFADPEHDLELTREPEHGLIAFRPPADLKRRLAALPQSYLREQKVTERLKLTNDRDAAEARLTAARDGGDSMWPDVGYLSDQHPVVDWLVDKALSRFGRNEAPVLVGGVEYPVVLFQGMCSNARGQATLVEWFGVELIPGETRVTKLREVLSTAGVGSQMTNPAVDRDLSGLAAAVPAAVREARDYVAVRRAEREAHLQHMLEQAAARAERFEQLSLELATTAKQRDKVHSVKREADALIDRLSSAGDPLIRIVGAILPDSAS